MLQRHSDINVTDAAGTNHVLGKYIAATLISKLKLKRGRMSVIQLLEIHLFCYCTVSKNKICPFWYLLLSMLSVYLYSVFIQIISAFVFVFGSKPLFSVHLKQIEMFVEASSWWPL